ncbi:MAG: ornithine cyclodeaminase family protein [Alphaproteobacteria bacterium]|nr:MAG: ornithine cyclodeaminase family protein [Alphaproteobacteria bacterium]
MQSVPHYDAAAVAQYLDYPGCIDAVRAAMAAFSADGRSQPLRNIVPVADGKLFALMPGLSGADVGFGAKVISVFPVPGQAGRTAHQGLVVLFDHETGAVVCVADAHEVTKRRTAAASAVATEALARTDARYLGIFGTGTQAESHILALTAVRDYDRILVWGRSLDTARAFAARLSAMTGLNIRAEADGEKVAADSNVICTTTGSAAPILFGDWVRPGTHVNMVGSSHDGPVEVDHALLLKGRYVADSRASVLAAGAEFLAAKRAGLLDDSYIGAEIGEVLLGEKAGRMNPDEITLYKSLGHVVQDLAAARLVHTRATEPRKMTRGIAQ